MIKFIALFYFAFIFDFNIPTFANYAFASTKIDTFCVAQHSEVDFLNYIDGVDMMVHFPGGNDSLMKYIERNIVYPDSALELGLSDMVLVNFAIDTLGKVCCVEIKRGRFSYLNNEVVRVISQMPNWIWSGNNVFFRRKVVQRTLPIYFNLPD